MTVPLPKKQVAALRAIAGALGGLRIKAYPSLMQLLVQIGLVEERPATRQRHLGKRAWFLAAEGREVTRGYEINDG